jgi:hypothetical protein
MVLMFRPPGAGTTMLAQPIPTIPLVLTLHVGGFIKDRPPSLPEPVSPATDVG